MFQKPFLRAMIALSIAPAMALAAQSVGKVRSTLGSVERLKFKQGEWAALSVNAKVYQYDRVKTGVESEVIFNFVDGSTISIAENTEVELVNVLTPNDNGGYETELNIKKGHLNFAVPKLQNKKSNFKFKTGTATASIRGTEGYVGGEGVFFAGLKSGKLEIVPNGSSESVSIVAGETTFGLDSLVVVKLASSGDVRFAKRLEKILKEKKPVSELVADVQKADSVYQKDLKDEAEKAAASVSANGFNLSTPSAVEVCGQGLNIEGFYRTSDESASLVVKVGSYQSGNLIKAADGVSHSFAHKIALTDENGLWNADKATITFAGAGVTETKTVNLQVNKACVEVNSIAPAVSISSYDSLRCASHISVKNMKNDAGVLTITADGAPVSEEAIVRNVQKRINLKEGRHTYVIGVVDQAGNATEVTESMGCYPIKRFNIDVVNAHKEVLSVPPPPRDIPDHISKTLQFRIKLPDNNPEALYKVVVKQNGKIILQETLGQIQDLDYQIPVELKRDALNRFDIEATAKSGYKAKARKVFEVR
ncbi:MAG: FecR family protein [Fibrobacter sp.]|nr:FecR family protein [Fibrobacter sp.]